MNKEIIYKLDRLRHNMLDTPVHQIMRVLLKYYEPDAKVIITKDCWHIEIPDNDTELDECYDEKTDD